MVDMRNAGLISREGSKTLIADVEGLRLVASVR
jgi:hypothetical protein